MSIEEEFYKTFGIEPKYQDTCIVEEKYWNNEELANEYGTFDMYMNAKCGNQENCTTECSCAYMKEIYPQITSDILLELICIENSWDWGQYESENVKDLKEEVLEDLIYYCKAVGDKGNKELKAQVQKLFEGGGRMKDETLVKDLTVAELKDLIRQIIQQELMFANRNVTECKGYELKEIKLPKRCEIIWGDDDVRKIR